MPLCRQKFRRAVGLVSALALAAPAVASAVSDLQGSAAAGALEAMSQRGYFQTSSYADPKGRYSYWWNNQQQSCVRLLTSDGRIAATKTSPATDCGQHAAQGKDSSGNAAAGVIAAAAVIAGVAALSSKSHHRNDQDYPDSQSYATFEQGYRDGLMGHSYHNYGNSRPYTDGYEAGVRDRGYESGYRGNSYFRGGYGGYVSLSDLVGQDRDWAENQMSARGFTKQGGYRRPEGGNTLTWWNPGTRQCVVMNTRHMSVQSVQDIDSGNCY